MFFASPPSSNLEKREEEKITVLKTLDSSFLHGKLLQAEGIIRAATNCFPFLSPGMMLLGDKRFH